MNSAAARRVLGTTLGAIALGLAITAPASYAGEDDDNTSSAPPATETASGGGGDSGSASGGVAAGAGGMAVSQSSDMLVPELLAGAGVFVLTAAGIAYRRRPGLGVGDLH